MSTKQRKRVDKNNKNNCLQVQFERDRMEPGHAVCNPTRANIRGPAGFGSFSLQYFYLKTEPANN